MEAELRDIMNMFGMNLQNNGISFNEYVELLGGDQSVVEEQFRPQALERAKTKLVLEKIAKDENITVTPEDLNNEVAAMAKMYGMTPEALMPRIDARMLMNDMLINKAVQYLKSVN